ncbi:hypothetical protein Tco_0757202 [Tanacetum coccineum]
MVAYLKKTEGSEGFHQMFWQTATASTLDNGEMEITATIDGKIKIVTETSIRRHLKLEDSDGISNLPTTEIFEQLALMGKLLGNNSVCNIATLDNGEMEITATIDGKVKIVTEASIRRHLKLEDSDGISNLPTTEIFEQAQETASTSQKNLYGSYPYTKTF